MEFCKRPFEEIYISDKYVKICNWMAMDTVLGNPLEQSLESMWNSEKAEMVRDSIRDGSFRYCNKETCPKCASGRMEEIEDDLGKDYKAETYPKLMNVSYDYVCNHKCPSCRDDFFRPDDAYKEKMKRLKETVLPFANNTEILSTCGMGDCFSSPFMMEFLSELRPENPNFHLSFETNGVFVDESHWAKIAHLHKYPINITVTPNSFDKYTYQYLSGGVDDLEKCKQSLKFISVLRKAKKIESFKINMVVQEANYWEIPSFIKTCLDEYDPDIIQIKPLNRWFGLDADGYWFKNVLNPKHPYHQNYLRVMQDPILKHPKVWDWTEQIHDRDSRLHPAAYDRVYVDLLYKLVADDDNYKKISTTLDCLSSNSIAIYGAWKYGEILYDILVKAGLENLVKCFIDKRRGNKGFICKDHEIRGVFLQDFSDIDTIIISVLSAKEEIIRDLKTVGYSGNIISVDELL